MNLQVTENLAKRLMQEHGLTSPIWGFEWDNSVKRFGVCKMRRTYDKRIYHGVIGLSKQLVLLNNEAKVLDVILHEIAHGLTPGHGHDYVWKQKCIEIGAKPIRCYNGIVIDVEVPKMRYQAECGGCGVVHQKTRVISTTRKTSCNCQRGKSWDNRILLTYVDTRLLTQV